MKKIEAIIRPAKVGVVCAALKKAGNPGLMIMEIEGYGRQRGIEQQFRGKTYKTELITKAKLDIIIKDEAVEKIVAVIKEAAYTGKEGDGMIFVSPVDDALRIRTGEKSDLALV